VADIFLSYAREDFTRAQTLAGKLELHGWSVWWDRHIPPGKDFTAFIQAQLDDARCIVVLWSKSAIASPFVRDEAAEGLNGRLVPLLFDRVRQPLGFRQYQAADLSDWTGESSDEFGRLIESVASIVPPRTSPDHAKPQGPFAFDVYISHSDLDDLPSVDESKGWVTNFGQVLELRLGQLLGRPTHIWLNAKGEDSGVRTEEDFAALKQTGAFVAVLSPHYVGSKWVVRELQEFSLAADQYGGVRVQGRTRIFKVVKTPIPVERTPDALKSLLGYEFFGVDPAAGTVTEFDQNFGPEAQHRFLVKLDDLAQDIAASLEQLRPSET
jgi:hypothetical protein